MVVRGRLRRIGGNLDQIPRYPLEKSDGQNCSLLVIDKNLQQGKCQGGCSKQGSSIEHNVTDTSVVQIEQVAIVADGIEQVKQVEINDMETVGERKNVIENQEGGPSAILLPVDCNVADKDVHADGKQNKEVKQVNALCSDRWDEVKHGDANEKNSEAILGSADGNVLHLIKTEMSRLGVVEKMRMMNRLGVSEAIHDRKEGLLHELDNDASLDLVKQLGDDGNRTVFSIAEVRTAAEVRTTNEHVQIIDEGQMRSKHEKNTAVAETGVSANDAVQEGSIPNRHCSTILQDCNEADNKGCGTQKAQNEMAVAPNHVRNNLIHHIRDKTVVDKVDVNKTPILLKDLKEQFRASSASIQAAMNKKKIAESAKINRIGEWNDIADEEDDLFTNSALARKLKKAGFHSPLPQAKQPWYNSKITTLSPARKLRWIDEVLQDTPKNSLQLEKPQEEQQWITPKGRGRNKTKKRMS